MPARQVQAREIAHWPAHGARHYVVPAPPGAHPPRCPRPSAARRASARVKLPIPQYRSSTRESRIQLQQLDRARSRAPSLIARVDLDEIRRREFKLQVQMPAARSAAAPRPASRRAGAPESGPPVCRYRRTPCSCLELPQRLQDRHCRGSVSTRSTSAIGIVGNGHLDLRHVLADAQGPSGATDSGPISAAPPGRAPRSCGSR